MTVGERTAPQSIDAEKAVLGSLLVDAEGAMPAVAPILAERDFYRGAHKEIYRAALALYGRREPTNVVLVMDELTRLGTLEAAGGNDYLLELINGTPTALYAVHYAGIVREHAVRRQVISVGGTVAGIGYDAGTAAEAVSRAQEAVLALSAGQGRDTHTSTQLASEFLDELTAVLNAPGRATGLSTGFRHLDWLTGGFRPGQVTILAARPGVGKTSLALHCAVLAAEARTATCVFTLEMAPDELFHRLACAQAGVDARRLRTGFVDDDEVYAVTQAAGRLAQLPLRVVDAAGMSVTDLTARARQEQAQHDTGMVIVDYLGLLKGSAGSAGGAGGSKSENRTQEVSGMSRELTVLARELRVPVLVLSQLNRQVEQRPGKRPQLSDLRESGALEQDAHVVLLLHQDEESGVPKGYLNVIVAKNRSGPTGEVSVAFDHQYTRFRDLDDTPGREAPPVESAGPSWPGAA